MYSGIRSSRNGYASIAYPMTDKKYQKGVRIGAFRCGNGVIDTGDAKGIRKQFARIWKKGNRNVGDIQVYTLLFAFSKDELNPESMGALDTAADIVAKMTEIEERTADNDSLTLCVALSYGGRQEIVAVAKKIARLVQNGSLLLEDVDCDTFASQLYTAEMPEPDLLIRTSGEQRISNYLLWQLAYSEMYFSPTLWPDFSKAELEEIVKEFNSRERRYGKS